MSPKNEIDDDTVSLVCPVSHAKRMLKGYSHQRVYDLINDGTLQSYKEGRRRFLVVDSIRRLIEKRLLESA